mgnify:CR=1 FL=1
MTKKKLQRFIENATFPNFIQPAYEDISEGFYLKGKWARDFFGNRNPIFLELGCGKGEYTVGLARKHPERNYIGIDRKGARMWRGGKTSVEENMTNTGFLRIRIEMIDHCFGRDEISGIWITFPDPHPKKSNRKKRLTSPEMLNRYKKILKPGGMVHLKTDDERFFEYTLDVIRAEGHETVVVTDDLYGSDHPGAARDIVTYYEKMHVEAGKKIGYLSFIPRQRVAENEGDTFFHRVYEVVRKIPYGRVTSYGAIAEYLGARSSARMVGWAMNASHKAPGFYVPAHRVVNRNGMLTGKRHFGGVDTMQQLLQSEGIEVANDRIMNFERHFWDPKQELEC